MTTLKVDERTPIFQLTVAQFRQLLNEKPTRSVNQPKEEIPEYFGAKTAAKISGYSLNTIYSKTSRKEIPHIKRNNKVLFNRNDFLSWLTENQVRTKTDESIQLDREFTKRRRAVV